MKTKLKLLFLSGFNGQKSHIAVKGLINGIEATLIIDTGASNCVLDTASEEKFNLDRDNAFKSEKTVGLGSDNIESNLARAKSFSLNEFHLKDFPFVLLDLSIINKSLTENGYDPIDGVIGTDLLLAGKSKINYKNKTIQFKGSKKKLNKKFKHLYSALADK